MAEQNDRAGILSSLVGFSLRFRGIIIALSLVLIGYGLYRLNFAKYDVYPEFAPPQVAIQTEAPGLSPEQVEALVTQPIENAINGIHSVETLRSNSIQGLSVITVVFNPGSDIYRARQEIAERLNTAQLPEGVEVPEMTPLTTSSSTVLMIGLTSEKVSLMDLRTVADWTIRQRLLAAPGVASIIIFGGEVKQFQIQVRPGRLLKYDLGLEEVIDAARKATAVQGAGFLDTDNQRIIINTQGQSLSPDQIGQTLVAYRNGSAITLSDLGEVALAPEPPFSAASIMGKPGVILEVSAQFGANTLEVTRNAESALKELEPMLAAQGIILHPDLFRPADFIQRAIHNVRTTLIIGAILVVAILFLFLFNLRTAIVSCSAIPLSLLGAITILERLGYSLNMMTLGGLAIAVGEVVDDAVVDVENIYRRLRENQHRENPWPVFQVILNASLEVRGAVIFATFSVVLVFIPILTMSGVAGRLFMPLGVAYISAVLCSLLVAFTVTPALCYLLLERKALPEREPPLVRWLKKRYCNFLTRADRRLQSLLAGVGVLILLGAAAVPFLAGSFLPELREGHFIIHLVAIPGTSLNESLRMGKQVCAGLRKMPLVRKVSQTVGRAEQAEDTLGTHHSEIHLELKPLGKREAGRAEEEIRNTLAGYPGANFSMMTFLSERVMETISGYVSPVVVNIFGDNLELLDQKAREVATVLNQIPGAAEVMVQSPSGTPELAIRIKSDAVRRWGFTKLEVLTAVRTAFQGEAAAEVYDGNRVFEVSVILHPTSRKQLNQVGKLPLRNSNGNYVLLEQLADIFETSGRYAVLHQGARRLQTVTCNVRGRDFNGFVREAEKQIRQKVSLPAGTYLEFTGAYQAQARSRHDLLVHSLIALAGILLILSVVTGHYRNLTLIILNLPFALVGGVFAAFLAGRNITVGSMVGFVTLFGITLRNSIMMLSHFEHLVTQEGMKWGLDTAIQGASERLAPILMTALVTAMGLMPLALASGAPGTEIEGPMAIIILGGLITSTLLNLLVIPLLARRLGKF